MSSQLDMLLQLDRMRPCPWCGAQPNEPCRANNGRGSELTKSVHPIRRKAAPAIEEASA